MLKIKLLVFVVSILPTLAFAQVSGKGVFENRTTDNQGTITIEYRPVTNLQEYVNAIIGTKKTIPLEFT